MTEDPEQIQESEAKSKGEEKPQPQKTTKVEENGKKVKIAAKVGSDAKVQKDNASADKVESVINSVEDTFKNALDNLSMQETDPFIK